MPGFKVCFTCKVEKPVTEFCVDNSRKDKVTSSCKNCRNIKTNEYYAKHPEKLKIRCKTYNLKHSEEMAQYRSTPEYKLKKSRQEKVRRSTMDYKIKRRAYYKQYLSVLQHRLAHNLRARIRLALKGISKTASTIKILGCSIDFFISYLESKFLPGMTRENYGLWQIDHIKPCNAFDLSDPKQLAECCHYTNLQPLWAKDNIIKSDKY